jgi:serine/threonine-protein kinase
MSPPTATGEVKGKFAYMSPEQVHGDQLDARADVFAMGIVLYRVTTGTHPFKSDNPAATLRNILSSGPARPSELVPLYPKALEDVVMKALARDRNNRFESAHEMMLALEQALPQEVQANSERNTEVFLRRLFAKRIAERKDALKNALLAADGLVALSTSDQTVAKQVHSQSTMRAVSVENGEPRVEVSERQPVIVTLPPRRRRSPLLIVAIAAGLLGTIGAGILHKSAQRAAAQRTGVDMGAPVAHAAAPTEALDRHDLPMVAKEAVPIVNTASSADLPPQVGPSTAPSVPSKKRGTRRAESTPASPEAASLPAPAPAPAPLNASPAGDPLDRRK